MKSESDMKISKETKDKKKDISKQTNKKWEIIKNV